MPGLFDEQERQRLALQAALDAQKSQAERNRLGQFATPTALAEDILRYAASLLSPTAEIYFLDPAIGTGSFYSALLKLFPARRIAKALGFELDSHYANPAAAFWKNHGLTLAHGDFTRAGPSPDFNVVICNPPYVRHHHLQNGEKARLQRHTQQASGMKLSGLAGLYCYFLGLAHPWMAKDGIAGWLVPSEFMDVNYGQAVKGYLLDCVTLIHIHRFDPNDAQFADALVSSALVWFKNAPPPLHHKVKFTFGGTLSKPRISRLVSVHELAREAKWTRFPESEMRKRPPGMPTLSDYFQIKRGLATGDNSYFILSEAEITARDLPMALFTPILPSPRYLKQDQVNPREDGSPDIERRLFLLDTKLSEEDIRERFPPLFTYLEEGKAHKLHQRYLCRHRSPWYSQENRPAAPIVCTYIGRSDTKRGRPFRFIRNRTRATVANVYLALYPSGPLARAIDENAGIIERIWLGLNNISVAELLGEGRVYGGGLHKLEPRELGNIDAGFLSEIVPQLPVQQKTRQLAFF